MKGHATRAPRIGITLGDPRGVGPEVVFGALRDPRVAGGADYVLIGPETHGAPFSGSHGVPTTGAPWSFDSIGEWEPGGTAADAGLLAGNAVVRAVELAMQAEIDAIVTAPIDKAAFHAAGWRFPGHTEMLSSLVGGPEVAMMMTAETTTVGGPLRVVLATTHLALRSVPEVFSAALLVGQARLTDEALRSQWGIPTPRLALCAFNPHASDGGLFGDEEERIYAPALEELANDGISASGPVPADTVFTRALKGEFDAVIAPYHDVGMAAFKTVSFGAGVNVTLGLPFPRTSPDHGTALDIAGRGIADPSSTVEAIRLAIRLASGVGTARK